MHPYVFYGFKLNFRGYSHIELDDSSLLSIFSFLIPNDHKNVQRTSPGFPLRVVVVKIPPKTPFTPCFFNPLCKGTEKKQQKKERKLVLFGG